MNAKTARQTAAARGFPSVKKWMQINRRERERLAARRKREPDLEPLIDSLDAEHARFSPFA